MTPSPIEVIEELREKLRQQVQATISAARTAELALMRLERQQPLVDTAVDWYYNRATEAQMCEQIAAFATWKAGQS
jgi:hypothetical protein